MPIPNPETIGITEREARLYELLIHLGEQDAGRLITESGFKRPTVYKSLYSMAEKGLVTETEHDGKAYFRPEPPQKLLNIAEQQYDQLNRARNDITTLLPELVSAFTLSTERPVVTTFTGVSGLKKIYEDTLKTGETIYAVLQTESVDPELFKWLTTDYVKRRSELGIDAKAIVASGDWADTYANLSETEKRDTRVVPKDRFPFEHEAFVYGNKFGIMNYKKGEKLIGLIIDHPQMTATMKAWFDLAWEGAESLSK